MLKEFFNFKKGESSEKGLVVGLLIGLFVLAIAFFIYGIFIKRWFGIREAIENFMRFRS